MRPIRVTVSSKALRHNYAVARRVAAGAKVYAVVKANAYGHGIECVASALVDDAQGFATVEPESALRLRLRGYTQPILLLEGVFTESELPEMSARDIAVVVHCEEQLRMLETAQLERPVEVFLKINTGMNRLGFPPDRTFEMVERLRMARGARAITLMSHFATADGPPGIEEAMRRFEAATGAIDLPKSLANSAAIFAHPRSHAQVARLGICLYGATPFADRTAESLGLRPAMTLTSKLIAVQELALGEAVGYGATYTARAPMRLGVVACGYADGYPRHAPSGTPVLVDGARTQTVGRVSMDMMMVDLTNLPAANVGSAVTLWGDELPIDEVAMAAGTVGYELMCAVAPRVKMVFV